MAIEKIFVNNIDKIVNADELTDVTPVVDAVTADAYVDSVRHAEVANEVITELEDKAAEVITANPEEPEVKQDSIYTKKHTLDEAIEEFDFSKIDASKDEDDRYTEFDMFDFIYNLFSSQTDSLIRPLRALSNRDGGRGRKKSDDMSAFMYQGSDKYNAELGEKGVEGVNQISTDVDGNIMLYQDSISKFDDVIDICKEYGFDYEGPTPKKAPWVRWNYSFKVIVPTYADGYPMEIEDYFEQQGIPMEDVMPKEFIRHRAKDIKKETDDAAVKVIYDKYVRKAANSNDPLDGFVKDMLNEIAENGIKCNTKVLKDNFFAEFEDDFEDEE